MGAASLKGSVYILPYSEDHLEALHWLTGEVSSLGGEAGFAKVERIETIGDEEIVSLFQAQRANDYAPIATALEALEVRLSSLEQQQDPTGLERVKGTSRSCSKTIGPFRASIFSIVHQGLTCRTDWNSLKRDSRTRLSPRNPQAQRPKPAGPRSKEDYQGRVWVTRRNPFVDRMASAWLIRRFIDSQAQFEFLETDRIVAAVPNGVSFDVPEGDFTHEEDRCTFEMLLETFGLRGKVLRRIAEVVHELDLKDGEVPPSPGQRRGNHLAGHSKRQSDRRSPGGRHQDV